MPTASDSRESTVSPGPGVAQEPGAARRLYRSNTDRVVAGICGGLGEYMRIDPVWIRVAFVLLTIGGGAGVLVYVVMWLVVPPAPEGYAMREQTGRVNLPRTAIVGIVFMIVGSIALVNTISPWLGQYFWPVAFVLGGLALVVGGLNRDHGR